MLVDPIQVSTPTNWMILQEEYRRESSRVPGMSGTQPQQDWISLLKAAVQKVRISIPLFFLPPDTVPPLSIVKWILIRFSLYDRGLSSSHALVEVS